MYSLLVLHFVLSTFIDRVAVFHSCVISCVTLIVSLIRLSVFLLLCDSGSCSRPRSAAVSVEITSYVTLYVHVEIMHCHLADVHMCSSARIRR